MLPHHITPQKNAKNLFHKHAAKTFNSWDEIFQLDHIDVKMSIVYSWLPSLSCINFIHSNVVHTFKVYERKKVFLASTWIIINFDKHSNGITCNRFTIVWFLQRLVQASKHISCWLKYHMPTWSCRMVASCTLPKLTSAKSRQLDLCTIASLQQQILNLYIHKLYVIFSIQTRLNENWTSGEETHSINKFNFCQQLLVLTK